MFKAVRLNAITYPVEEIERIELARAGAELIEIEGQEPQEILVAAEDCDALLVVSSRVPGSVIERLSRCRVISRLGAGTDKIDVTEATRRGILVTNVPDFCLNEQAEHTLALLLAFARRLPFMTEAMRTFRWTARQHPGVHRIAGQKLGLIGFGASAQAVAVRAAAFGLKLSAWVRDPRKYAGRAAQLQVQLLPLEQLLCDCDFASIHLPLCDDTRHLLTAERLALLKPTAVVINTARGAIIDEAALVNVLQQRQIAGAALDVFDELDVFALPGTPAEHPLLELDNVILTPHCAGSSVESSHESKFRGARNAADVLLGIPPESIVNPHVVPRELPPDAQPFNKLIDTCLQKTDPELLGAKESDSNRELTVMLAMRVPFGELEHDDYCDVRYRGGLFTGTAIRVFEGVVIEECNFLAGERHGEFKECFDDGAIKELSFFRDGREFGRCEVRYPNGKLKHLLNYDADGILLNEQLWSENGELILSFDRVLAIQREWRLDGSLRQETIFEKSSDQFGNLRILEERHFDQAGCPTIIQCNGTWKSATATE